MKSYGLSIIIPIRNQIIKLNKCICSVYSSYLYSRGYLAFEFEIIVVDDHSSINLNSIINQNQFTKLIKNINYGPGSARNMGVKEAKYDIIGFIDSDCIAAENWILIILQAFMSGDDIIIQGDPTLFQKRQNVKLGIYEEKLYNGLFSSYILSDYCTQVDTRNCAIKKDLLTKFREILFIEDMKKAQAEARVLGKELVTNGIKIKYISELKVFHEDPKSLKIAIKQKARHGSGRIYVWDRTPSFKYLFLRYYWNPIIKFRVPFWYVIPTHSAFILGYFIAKWKNI